MVVHYTISLLSARYLPPPVPERLTRFKGLKVQFIQDEYRAVDAVTAAMRSLGIDVLFTCVPEPAAGRSTTHASQRHSPACGFTLPGYVPDELVGREVPRAAERPIDVGYRGRDLPLARPTGTGEDRDRTRLPRARRRPGLRCDISSRGRTTGSTARTGTASWRHAGPRSARRAARRLSTSTAVSRRSARTTWRGDRTRPREIERDLTGPYEGKVVINTASPRLSRRPRCGPP